MAYIVPNSDVYLLKDIKCTPTYTDTIYFASKTAQTTYFTNITDFSLNSCLLLYRIIAERPDIRY